jgi:hypothetical protein
VVGRGVSGGGEAETSPETGTVRLAARSPAEVRSRNLGWGAVVAEVWLLSELGKIDGFRVRVRDLRIQDAVVVGATAAGGLIVGVVRSSKNILYSYKYL